MRVAFLLLLMVNVVLAGWMSGILTREERSQEVVAASPVAGHSSNLRLLHELAATERVRVTPPAEKRKPADPPPKPDVVPTNVAEAVIDEVAPQAASPEPAACYRISDIVSKEQQEGLEEKVSVAKASITDRGEVFNERQAFWVYIPPMKNNSAAQDVIGALAKAKVRDYLLVRSGEFQYAISLGIFSQREGANKRAEEITALRLKAPRPLIALRTSTYRSYWLLVRETERGGELERLLKAEKVSLLSVDCPP